MDIRKIQLMGFALMLGASVLFSAGTTDISQALHNLCKFINELVPVVVMLMLVGAGAIYAGGQMMGAETRARANVWATSMLVGAIIGIVIIVVAPEILKTMLDPSGAAFSTYCS